MATINRAKLLKSLAEHVPDFDPMAVLAVSVFPTYVTADVVASTPTGGKCWKPGCTDRTRHSHPKRREVRGGTEDV